MQRTAPACNCGAPRGRCFAVVQSVVHAARSFEERRRHVSQEPRPQRPLTGVLHDRVHARVRGAEAPAVLRHPTGRSAGVSRRARRVALMLLTRHDRLERRSTGGCSLLSTYTTRARFVCVRALRPPAVCARARRTLPLLRTRGAADHVRPVEENFQVRGSRAWSRSAVCRAGCGAALRLVGGPAEVTFCRVRESGINVSSVR